MYTSFFNKKATVLLSILIIVSLNLHAQPKEPGTLSNPLAQALLAIMVLLALAIGILASVVNQAAGIFREKLRKEREAAAESKTLSGSIVTGVLILAGLFSTTASFAQSNPAVSNLSVNINGLTPFTFTIMMLVIAVEIIILIALVYQLKFLMGIEKIKVAVPKAAVEEKPKVNWWWKINKANDLEKEEDIDLSHDYDGISELDNKLPPWWIAAFALTILFSVVYMYRYHVSGSAPLQIEELNIAMKQAEIEKKAYLAKSANNVDENTVVMLDATAITAGKSLFGTNCIACHGNVGEGNAVGPNLTDEYWLHGGDLSSIFKSIKYGWPDKGMRSWKDDFSPIQVAQLTSYIKSIQGSNPPNAREPQGEKFEEGIEQANITDSAGVASVSPM